MPQTKELSGETIRFKNAYYIKLGAGGKWEADSIQTGRARIGWSNIPGSSLFRVGDSQPGGDVGLAFIA